MSDRLFSKLVMPGLMLRIKLTVNTITALILLLTYVLMLMRVKYLNHTAMMVHALTLLDHPASNKGLHGDGFTCHNYYECDDSPCDPNATYSNIPAS